MTADVGCVQAGVNQECKDNVKSHALLLIKKCASM
jgi:hypothetical protein